jgi:hypothetical protein
MNVTDEKQTIPFERIEEINEYWNNHLVFQDYPGKCRTLSEALQYGAKCCNYVKAKASALVGAGADPEEIMVGLGITEDGINHSVLVYEGWVLDNPRGHSATLYPFMLKGDYGFTLLSELRWSVFNMTDDHEEAS